MKMVFFFKLPLDAVLPGGIMFGYVDTCILEQPVLLKWAGLLLRKAV